MGGGVGGRCNASGEATTRREELPPPLVGCSVTSNESLSWILEVFQIFCTPNMGEHRALPFKRSFRSFRFFELPT